MEIIKNSYFYFAYIFKTTILNSKAFICALYGNSFDAVKNPPLLFCAKY